MIRALHFSELPRMKEIGESFAKEASYPGGFCLDHFVESWGTMLKFGLSEILVHEKDGRITSALGAAFIKDGFSGRPVAMESFWYVLPEFRSAGVGMPLFFAFEEAARLREATRVIMVHLAELAPAKMKAFYESQGYRMVEQTFWKEL